MPNRLRALLATARVHSPLFTLRGGTNEVLRGVVAKGMGVRPMNELAQLVDDLGRRSLDARVGHRFPESFDEALWRNLEDTGLARLTSSQDAGPAEAAIVLSGLARHAAAVPIAETDLLAAWLAGKAGLPAPDSRPVDRRDRRSPPSMAAGSPELPAKCRGRRHGRIGGADGRCAARRCDR